MPTRKLGPKPPPDAAAVKVARQLVETQVLDAIDAACANGTIVVSRGPAAPIGLTDGQLVELLRLVAPAHFRPPAEAPPSATAPGSAERVRVYEQRVRKGLAVFAGGDAKAG